MTDILTFNFHNRLGVQVESADAEALRFFQDEYCYAMGPLPEGVPVVELKWRRSSRGRSPQSGYQNYTHKYLARWSYRILIEKEKVSIEVFGNRFAIPMVHHMMLHPSLRLLASRIGILLLHSSAISADDQSLVFTGKGGAGKTTTSSLFLAYGRKGWGLHADDYVFLAPGPRTLAYLTRSHLYDDWVRWVPKLRSHLSITERMGLRLFGRLRAWTGIKWPVRISAKRLWPDKAVHQQADLKALIILSRAPIRSPRISELAPHEAPVHDLVEMNFSESDHFQRLVGGAPERPSEPDWLEQWRRREEALLQNHLESVQ